MWKRSNPSQDIRGKEGAPRNNSLPSPLLRSPAATLPCCCLRATRGRVEEAIPLFSTTYSVLSLSPGSEPAKPHEAHFPLYTNRGGTGEREREREREGALVHDWERLFLTASPSMSTMGIFLLSLCPKILSFFLCAAMSVISSGGFEGR
jgi:hypothetical protein